MSDVPKPRRPGQFGGADHSRSKRLSSARGGAPRGRRDSSGCLLLLIALPAAAFLIATAAAQLIA